MTTKNLNNLEASNPKIATFVKALVASGVSMERLLVNNQYNKGTKKLIVIPVGKENNSQAWHQTTAYSEQQRVKIISIAAEPVEA